MTIDQQLAEQEIARLHDFFVKWMTGIIDGTDENFARFADSIDDSFYIIAPSGQLMRRASLIDGLYNTYNQRHNFRIWIRNVQLQFTRGDIAIVTYEEWQEFADEKRITARLSTVVLTVDESVPHGLLWQCVHETWLPRST